MNACLEQIALFPSKSIKPGKPKSEYIYIFCACRMPAEADEHMAQCTISKEWYHKSCEHILDAVFRDQIETGNVPRASKDELKRQGYSCTVHNS